MTTAELHSNSAPRRRRFVHAVGRTAGAGIVLLLLVAAAMVVPAATDVAGARPPIRVLIVGNSLAGTLAYGSPVGEDAHGVATQRGFDLTNRNILACGISSLPTVVLVSGPAPNACGGSGHWQQQWLTDVISIRPDVVLVAAGDHDIYDEQDGDGTMLRQGSQAWTTRYSDDVAQLFRVLHASGAPVVAVTPGCYGLNTLDPTDASPPERRDPARVRAVQSVWRRQARQHSGVEFLDLDRVVCPSGASDPTIRPDGVHFGQYAADLLAPRVARALRAAVNRH